MLPSSKYPSLQLQSGFVASVLPSPIAQTSQFVAEPLQDKHLYEQSLHSSTPVSNLPYKHSQLIFSSLVKSEHDVHVSYDEHSEHL